jgi:hypothetical protein
MNAERWWTKTLLGTGSGRSLEAQCDEIAQASPDDVRKIAGILQKMIVSYYEDVRRQALMAFVVALVLEIVAVVFFGFAAYRAMGDTKIATAGFSALAGFLIQMMTAVVFYLYSQSAKQFGAFHICLERTNRFLLANAMVENLPEAERTARRAEVIITILQAPMLTLSMIERGV